jgi:transposase-like protein
MMGNMVSSTAKRPETEVSDKAKRRRFSTAYKQRILREAAACTEPGAISALLRREGLYSSHLFTWRHLAERGEAAALTPKKRGPQPKANDERDKRIIQLERDNAKLMRRAERAEAMVEVQKKVSQLLGIVLPTPEEQES